MSSPFKVVALSMATKNILWGKAALAKNMLVMAQPETIPNDFDAILSVAKGKILPLVEKHNYYAVADGNTTEIAMECEGKHVNFNKPDLLSTVYLHYQELMRQGRIVYPPKQSASFQIPGNMVNAIRTPDGTLRHEFNWEQIKGEQIYTLLIVHAAMTPHIARPTFFRDFFNAGKELVLGAPSGVNQPESEMARSVDMLNKVDQAHQEKNRTTSLAGTQIDENSWYL